MRMRLISSLWFFLFLKRVDYEEKDGISMGHTSSHKRTEIKQQLREEELDILVIGGGITGSGIALDAVNRGMKTGIIEMQDFAAGTSSRSTKLVHGGLRYLKQFEVGLVAEVGKERAIVYENGPHVTTPEWMMLPFYKGGTFGPLSTNVGLRVYDFLAGVKKSERRKMLSTEEALQREPLLQSEELKGAGYYVEYKTDDARLTIEVMKKAMELGANALNYAQATAFIYNDDGQVNGVVAKDKITGEEFNIFAKQIVNAAGPWVDELRDKDGSKTGKTLQLTKGSHLIFKQDVFPLQQAIYFDTPDKRMIFAIPRGDKAYVGTTDTKYNQNIAHPEVTKEDRDYLLHAINQMFPSLALTAEHIDSSYVGVRPLISEPGKDPGEISRKDEIFVSDSGLISMAGGKLTGYRKMAQQAVDKVATVLQKESGILYEASSTVHLPISGGDVGGSKGFERFKNEQLNKIDSFEMSEEEMTTLVDRYGGNTDKVLRIFEEQQKKANYMDPVVLAELIYAIEEELTYTPSDFFIRRTSALFFDIDWVRTHKDSVIRYMSEVFSWDEATKQRYTDELEAAIEEAALTALG